MRSVRRKLRGPSIIPKTQRNRALLLRTRFTTLWRSGIRIYLKIDADAGVAFVSGVQYGISLKGYGGRILDTAHASKTHVLKSKIERNKSYRHYFQCPNLT